MRNTGRRLLAFAYGITVVVCSVVSYTTRDTPLLSWGLLGTAVLSGLGIALLFLWPPRPRTSTAGSHRGGTGSR